MKDQNYLLLLYFIFKLKKKHLSTYSNAGVRFELTVDNIYFWFQVRCLKPLSHPA